MKSIGLWSSRDWNSVLGNESKHGYRRVDRSVSGGLGDSIFCAVSKSVGGEVNLAVTNRITRHFVEWMPGFGMLTHVGRKSRAGLSNAGECFSAVRRIF